MITPEAGATPRRRRAALVAIVLVATVAVAAVALAAGGRTLRPGVQAHLLLSDVGPAQAARQLDSARAAGASLVRVDVGWSNLAPSGPGRYDGRYLARIDSVVAAANRRGMTVLFMLWTTPCWASSAPASLRQGCVGRWWERGVQKYPPRQAGQFAAALGFLAHRYRGRQVAWEVWNEPNSPDFFVAADPAASYAALLRAAYPAAKRGDPRTTVVGGALTHSDVAFTEALYAHGVKGYFDAFSVHPYSDDRSPEDDHSPLALRLTEGVSAIHATMARHGDPKPIWLTELGWSTATTRGARPWQNGVDEATQARYLEQAYDQVSRLPYVEATVWFNLIDTSHSSSDSVGNFGLLRHDWSAKPAYDAFQRTFGAP